MQFVHYTVFALGWLRRMNFVTQPGVELYKAITAPIVAKAGPAESRRPADGSILERPDRPSGGTALRCIAIASPARSPRTAATPGRSTPPFSRDCRRGTIEYGELTFFGDTRYDSRGQCVRRTFEKAAERVFRAALKMPVDVYEGPAMNHTYHEISSATGAASPLFVWEKSDSIPPAGYTADYHRAQFLATQMALEQRARPVVALTVKDLEPASLASLDEFFKAVATRLK